jgi:hypothetical protein
MANIDDFKANLIGGGARANQFRVTITPPSGITISEIAIPFRGRQIFIAGDRTFDDPWTTTFMNDTDFGIRTAMELWMNGINDLANATGVTNLADYQTDLQVEQLDRDDTILKTYVFRNAWPTTVAAIELTSENADAIEEFEVTWRYQHFEASGVNF